MPSLSDRVLTLVQSVGADVKALFARSMPAGGTSGQVFAKTSGTNFAVGWADATAGGGVQGIPAGGAAGQVLSKSSGVDYAVGWSTPAGAAASSMTWRGYVNAVGGNTEQTHNSVNCRHDFYLVNYQSAYTGGSFSYLAGDYSTPLQSIPGISYLATGQSACAAVYLKPNVGGFFKQGSTFTFKAKFRFGFVNFIDGDFFAGVVGTQIAANIQTITGLTLLKSWANFMSGSGYAGAALGIGWKTGDANLSFVRIQKSSGAAQIAGVELWATSITRASVLNHMLDLEMSLANNGTAMILEVKNPEAGGVVLATATLDLAPSVSTPDPLYYLPCMGIGNGGAVQWENDRFVPIHLLISSQYGPSWT